MLNWQTFGALILGMILGIVIVVASSGCIAWYRFLPCSSVDPSVILGKSREDVERNLASPLPQIRAVYYSEVCLPPQKYVDSPLYDAWRELEPVRICVYPKFCVLYNIDDKAVYVIDLMNGHLWWYEKWIEDALTSFQKRMKLKQKQQCQNEQRKAE